MALRSARDGPPPPLGLGSDGAAATAVMPEPAAAFLGEPALLRARYLATRGRTLEALDQLAPWVRDKPACAVAAADLLAPMQQMEKAAALLRGASSDEGVQHDKNLGRWVSWHVMWLAGGRDSAAGALLTWIDEIEQHATDIGEITLVRECLHHLDRAGLEGAGEPVARLRRRLAERLEWPRWLDQLSRATADLALPALVATPSGWFAVRPGGLKRPPQARRINGIEPWLERQDVAAGAHSTLFGPVNPRGALALGLALYVAMSILGVRFVVIRQRRAAALAEARGELIARVAHELRTPLTVLRMYAETLIQDRVGPDRKIAPLTCAPLLPRRPAWGSSSIA